MKIVIKEEGKYKINLHFPLSGLILEFAMGFVRKKKGIEWLEKGFVKSCVRELKKFRKLNGKFELVHVENTDGTEVLIRI